MPYNTLVEDDCPVRRIVPDRRRNGEPSRQFRIDEYILRAIQRFDKAALDAILRCAVSEDIILNGFVSMECLVEGLSVLFSSEDTAVIAALDLVVGNTTLSTVSIWYYCFLKRNFMACGSPPVPA